MPGPPARPPDRLPAFPQYTGTALTYQDLIPAADLDDDSTQNFLDPFSMASFIYPFAGQLEQLPEGEDACLRCPSRQREGLGRRSSIDAASLKLWRSTSISHSRSRGHRAVVGVVEVASRCEVEEVFQLLATSGERW
jgi:hypothetical protein